MSFAKTWSVNIGCSLLQVLSIAVFGMAFYFGSYILGGLIWAVSGNAQLGLQVGPIVSVSVVYITYAAAWYLFWLSLLNNGKIQWFYSRMIFSMIPLVVLVCLFHPLRPDPMSMALVNVPNEFIFSSEVAGMIMFPLYSFGLYKYVFPTKRGKQHYKKLAVLWVAMIVIGSMIFSLAWSTMGRVYA